MDDKVWVFLVSWWNGQDERKANKIAFKHREKAVECASALVGKYDSIRFKAVNSWSMENVKDAPWIRQAENDGVDTCDDVHCPICNGENPEWFFVSDGQVIGCSACVERTDPWDWNYEH